MTRPAPERIVAAAVNSGKLIHSVPRPGRHHHILHALYDLGVPDEGPDAQGFVTSWGRFVDRRAGLMIATEAEQIKTKHGQATVLYSEDMW